MKKILITTYHFYPEIAPRAFRAFELAKELASQGHNVDVVTPNINYNYSEIEEKCSINIYPVSPGIFLNRQKTYSKTSLNVKYHQFKKLSSNSLVKKAFYCFFPGGKSIEYAITLYYFLKKHSTSYDGVISIGLPLSVHFATSLYISKNNHLFHSSIADYGDPFSTNKEIPFCFYYKFLEKWILKKFKYITIPTKDAEHNFFWFKSKEYIKVIPQGFDFSQISIAEYKKNSIPTFGYAGLFYETIRNPKILFDFLSTLAFDFRFIIYTDTRNAKNMSLIAPYIDVLGEKLTINHIIPREDCIYELSQMDFIINQNNLGAEQKPSKLIDYMVAMRPIFHFNQTDLDQKKFLTMFEYDPVKEISMKIDYTTALQQFDTSKVTQNFLDLMNKK